MKKKITKVQLKEIDQYVTAAINLLVTTTGVLERLSGRLRGKSPAAQTARRVQRNAIVKGTKEKARRMVKRGRRKAKADSV